jgi:hypothetical protein
MVKKIEIQGVTYKIPDKSIIIGLITETKHTYNIHIKPLGWKEKEVK